MEKDTVKFKNRMKWHYQLFFYAIIIAILPAAFISYNLINKTEEELTQSINTNLTHIADLAAETINDFLIDNVENLNVIKNSVENEKLGINEKLSILQSTVESIPRIFSISLIVDDKGKLRSVVHAKNSVIDSLLNSIGSSESIILTDTQLCQNLISENRRFGSPIYIKELDKWILYLVLNVKLKTATNAYILAGVDLSKLQQELDSPKFSSIGNLVFVNNIGESVFGSSKIFNNQMLKEDLVEMLSTSARVTQVSNYLIDGKKYFVAISFPANVKWAVVAAEDMDNAYLLVKEMNNTMFIWISIGILLAIVIVIFVTKKIRTPITSLAEKANQISSGNFDIEVDYKSNDSIGVLGNSMQSMGQSLKQSFSKIEKQKNQLEEYSRTLEEKVKDRTKELKETNDDLQKAYMKVLELNNEKNEFLGIAAHDLKNPLSAIKGFGTIIKEDELSKDELTDFAGNIIESSERMFDIIISLLDINRIEEGRVEISYSEVDVNEMVKTLVRQNSENANRKNIPLLVNYLEPNQIVQTDDALVLQILDNFLSNAIKFSKAGQAITVNAMINSSNLEIAVRDNGPGLSDKDKEKLFKKFAKLSARPTGGENSTGLGLSIAKKIAEMLGGDIIVTSELGKGSEFKLIIPN